MNLGWVVAALLVLVSVPAESAEDPAAMLDEAGRIDVAEPDRARALVNAALTRLQPQRELPLWLRAQSQKCWLVVHAAPREALTIASAALAVAPASVDAQAGHLRVCSGYAHERLDELGPAQDAYEQGVAIGRASGDHQLLAQALALRGEVHYVRGAWGEAMVDLKAAYEAAEAADDDDQRRYVLNAIANLYGSAGEHERAIQYYQQSLRLAQAAGLDSSVANALYNTAVTYDKLGRHEDALARYREVLAIHERTGDGDEIASTLRSMAIGLIKLGRPADALELIERARHSASGGDEELAAAIRLTRGSALRALGRAAEALPDLDAALAWFEPAGALPFLEKILDERAQALALLGRHPEALAARERQLQVKEELHQSWRQEQTARLRVEFDTDKTEQENRALQTENALRAAALEDAERIRELQWGVIASAGLALAALLALVAIQIRNSRRLRRIALTDELTGLPNRRATIAHAQAQWERRAQSRARVGVVALDIDHFKRINDTYGHDAGDVVLKRVAARLRESFKPGFVGRVGGEEFLAVIAANDAETAIEQAERARRAVENIDLSDVHPGLRTSSSFGIATADPDERWEDTARRADAALYRAKSGGRNQVVVDRAA